MFSSTASSFDEKKRKECLLDVIQRAEAVRITVSAVVTDMGTETRQSGCFAMFPIQSMLNQICHVLASVATEGSYTF